MNFVFDIDGTICFDGQTIETEITDFLLQRVVSQPRHQLIFASARPVRDILPVLPKVFHDCHLIGANGAMCYFKQQPIWTNPLAPEDVPKLRQYIYEQELDYLIDEAWNYSFHGQTLDHLIGKVDCLKTAEKLPLTDIQQPVKVLLSNYRDQEKVIADLRDLAVTFIPYPRENCLDLTKKGVNKASALRTIIQQADYVAFGNDHNDIELLQGAISSVCVGNNQVVAKLASQVIPENTASIIEALAGYL